MSGAAGGGWRILVRDMVLQASIGVYPHESQGTQRVRVTVELTVMQAEAGRDRLEHVLNYERVVESVRSIVGAGHVRLVETLAERIAVACLADPRVEVARVGVEKLDVWTDVGSVGVELERRRSSTGGG